MVLKIQSHENIVIGNNFHSGIECIIITDIHNYGNDLGIPYDIQLYLKTLL